MGYSKNEEGENSKVAEVREAPSDKIQVLHRPWDSKEQLSIPRKCSQCEAPL